jgi:hypothetical protein
MTDAEELGELLAQMLLVLCRSSAGIDSGGRRDDIGR